MATLTIYCPRHPKWNMKKPPRSSCHVCWIMWYAVSKLREVGDE